MSASKPLVSFLADECVATSTVLLLKDLGYPVIRAQESGLAGKTDEFLLGWAIKNNMAIVTEDKDFTNILRFPPSNHHGIIVLRIQRKLRADVHRVLKNFLSSTKPLDLAKTLVIINASEYRLRKE